jgi:RHS repeat-associated protein
LTADQLGSTRLVTDGSATPLRCIDYLPFGEEIPEGIGGRGECYGTAVYPGPPDAESIKFTGKERDAETGLDYFGARYFSGAQGRFTSPDKPLVDQNPLDPQSWNLYSYGRNDPLTNMDPSGRSCVKTTTPDGKESQGDNGDGKGCEAAGVNPTKDQQPPPENYTGDIKPNPNSTGDPNNPEIQGNTATAKVQPFSISALVAGAREFIESSPFPVTFNLGVGVPAALNTIGGQVSVTIIPNQRTMCVSPGIFVQPPTENPLSINAGLLMVGPLGDAASIAAGPSVTGTLQRSGPAGYQQTASSSGTLGGPTFGPRGINLSAGIGFCRTF